MKRSFKQQPWIVLTGATGGIGQAICARCVSDGYNVLALGRDTAKLQKLEDQFPDTVIGIASDLASPTIGKDVQQALMRNQAEPTLHGVVHAAGISKGAAIEETTDESWYESMDVNTTSIMRILRELVPALKETEGASIVLVSSPVALVGARKVGYSASKAALHGMNAALSSRLGEHGIRVNAVLPGPTITPMTDDWSEDKRTMIAQSSPFKRLCRPEETAGVVSFLLGPDSSALTGTIIDATGGRHIGFI